MNWLQKIAQNYTDIAHPYPVYENGRATDDESDDEFIAWYYRDGKIYDEINVPHSDMKANVSAISGRIDPQTNKGSISFNEIEEDRSLQKQVINLLVDKYPGIKFTVWGRLHAPGVTTTTVLGNNRTYNKLCQNCTTTLMVHYS